MLISGADINQRYFFKYINRDVDGNTALHICAIKGYTEMLAYIAQIMIDDRAYMCGKPDFLSHNNSNKTPIELVTDEKTRKFLRCCCDRYRRINHNDQNSGTTLKHIKDKIRRETGDDESIKKLFFIVEGVPILTSQVLFIIICRKKIFSLNVFIMKEDMLYGFLHYLYHQMIFNMNLIDIFYQLK